MILIDEEILKIKNATEKGYLEAKAGDGVDISGRMEYHRGTVQKGISQTITTMGGNDIGVVVKEGQMATTTFPNGYGHGPRTHDESVALNTVDRPSVKQNLRIRKLTPCECMWLMGFEKEDYEAMVNAGLVDSNIYHIAGDSIVVPTLMSIFSNLINDNDTHRGIVENYVDKLKGENK